MSLGCSISTHWKLLPCLLRFGSLNSTTCEDRNIQWIIYSFDATLFYLKATNHEEIISQSLTSEETKHKVVNFLSKVCDMLWKCAHQYAGIYEHVQ